jgi:hypothetical protein
LLRLLTAGYGTNAKSSNVRATAAFGGKSGRDMLTMSSSHFDPNCDMGGSRLSHRKSIVRSFSKA